MTGTQLQKKIEETLTGAQAQVHDLTGTSDHWQVLVVCPLFEGKSMIDQHRMVKAVFEKDIQTGEVHALTLKTYTPSEWAQKSGARS